MEKLTFCDPQTGEADLFYVLEQTTINGQTYLLVTEKEEGDCDALILKMLSSDDEGNDTYELVEDGSELDSLSNIFMELLEDVEIG